MVEERLEVVVRAVRLSETMRYYSERAYWVYSSIGYQYFASIIPESGKCRRSQICFFIRSARVAAVESVDYRIFFISVLSFTVTVPRFPPL